MSDSDIHNGSPKWKSVAERNETNLNEKQELALFWIASGFAHYVPYPNMKGRDQYRWFVGETEITSQVKSLMRRKLVGFKGMDLIVRHENIEIYNREKRQRAMRAEMNKKIIRERERMVAEMPIGTLLKELSRLP